MMVTRERAGLSYSPRWRFPREAVARHQLAFAQRKDSLRGIGLFTPHVSMACLSSPIAGGNVFGGASTVALCICARTATEKSGT